MAYVSHLWSLCSYFYRIDPLFHPLSQARIIYNKKSNQLSIRLDDVNSKTYHIFYFRWEITSTVAASPSYLMLQKQLQKFSVKPIKIFAIDESSVNSVLPSHQNQIENHLNLIQSDDLRDKLTDFNDKVKESFTNEDQSMSNYLHVMFKDILTMIHRDPEFSNSFTSSLSDVAITICLILKNDFTNQLLPAQFYLLGNNGNNFRSSKLNLNTSDIDSGQNQTSQVVNTFNPNSYTLNLINEAINQRVIFVLFKGKQLFSLMAILI